MAINSTIYSMFNDVISTTHANEDGKVYDNVSKHNALFRRIADKDKVTKEDGGYSIRRTLDYAENSTYQRYSGFDVLNINATDVLTTAEYAWRNTAMSVSASGTDLRNTFGNKQSFINYSVARYNNAKRSFANGMSSDLYSDGTLPNQIGGLQLIVSDIGTGTVGGINSTTNPFWQNVVQSAANPLGGGGAVTLSPSTIENIFLGLWVKLNRNGDMPDFIVCDDTIYQYYELSQTSIKRYTTDGNQNFVGGAGPSIKYKTADVFFDSSGGIPPLHAYFLNTDFLEVVVHSQANMNMREEVMSINQDAVVKTMLWQGNLICTNRSLQGVVTA